MPKLTVTVTLRADVDVPTRERGKRLRRSVNTTADVSATTERALGWRKRQAESGMAAALCGQQAYYCPHPFRSAAGRAWLAGYHATSESMSSEAYEEAQHVG